MWGSAQGILQAEGTAWAKEVGKQVLAGSLGWELRGKGENEGGWES